MDKKLSLFEGFGVELEYMIVRKDNLTINPIADKVLYDIAGSNTNEFCDEFIGWSNELALHILEFKNILPTPYLNALPDLFMKEITRAATILNKYDSMLLPSGAHPFMNPHNETKLWESENTEIYHTYDKIFNCKGHGWSNLQSTHLNLPFNGDEEFGRLHAAIRIIMPLIPALAASTPIIESSFTGFADTRLEYYRKNQQQIPIISGSIIPEQVFSIDEYHEKILKQIYNAISPFDPNGILQEEWLNSRGAIARFDRNAIEIRTIDIQECPTADIFIVQIITTMLKALTEDILCDQKQQRAIHETALLSILLNTIKNGSTTIINDLSYLSLFEIDKPLNAQDLILSILKKICTKDDFSNYHKFLSTRTISEQIINKYQKLEINTDINTFINKEYQNMAYCLKKNEIYI